MGLLTLRECPEAYHELLGVSFPPFSLPPFIFQYLVELVFHTNMLRHVFFGGP